MGRTHAGHLGLQRIRPRLLDGDWLEPRMAPAITPLEAAVPLVFGPLNTAQTSHFLATPHEFDLYAVNLQSGDEIDASLSAQQAGSGLTGLLRVFNAEGIPLALDNQQGGDPALDFQATTSGTYDIGVSSAPDNNYDPSIAGSGTAGGTTGQYTLNVRLTPNAPLQPDLTGASFRTGVDGAAVGDYVPVSFTIQNRGAADPGNFQVQVVLGDTNVFSDGSVQVLATLPRSALVPDATGRGFSSPSGLCVTLPVGVTPGAEFIGTRIVADPQAPEAGSYDKVGVHKGADWEPLAVESLAPAGTSNLSTVNASLFTEATGTLSATNPVAAYTFTVTSTLGTGELKAEVAAPGGTLQPRLTLSTLSGHILIQSDSGQIVQALQPGMFILSVSEAAGAGPYRLTTTYTQTCQPFAPLPSGAGTAWVATGDLNGDGIPDIVVANRIDDTVSVFLGNGDGTFLPPKTYGIGDRVWRVTLAAVTNNGRLDILTANKGDNTISILMGNGDGTFQPETVIPVGTRPGNVTVADLTGDGIPDLIVNNYAADTIEVLLGNGNGTFQAGELYATNTGPAFAGPGPVAVADINGDGIPDLVYPNYISGNVAVRLGLGNGTFGPQVDYPAEAGSYSVKLVDLTGDGRLDIVDANAVANTVSVLMNNGNGTFQPQQVYPVGFDPYAMTVGDLNGDGAPDIVTANRGDNTVSVLLNNGNGTFQPQAVYPTGNAPRGVDVADLTGNGVPDIVATNQGDDTVTVLMGNGDGTFSLGAQQTSPAPNLRPFQVVVADLNGDGIPDIVTADRSNNSVSVLLGNRDGSFQTRQTYPTGRLPISVAVGVLTGDGIPDIVTANYAGSTVSVLLGNGDGTFRPYYLLPAGSDPYDVKLADLTGDGKEDIVVTNKNDNTVGVLLGNGNGTFQPMVPYTVASGPYEVVVADLTRNGIPDLVVSHFSATVVDVLMGYGNGKFQPAQEYPVGSHPYGLAVADLTGDGIPDIVTANYRDNDVSVLLGNGDGTFQPPVPYTVGKAPNEVQVGDFTGDGIPDIVTANYGSGTVSVLLGNGNGTFQPQQTFPAGKGPGSVWVADLNRDGVLDLVVANRNASAVNVLMGNGNGTFQPPVAFGIGPNRYSVTVADVNGDGKPDIITTSLDNNAVTVQLGNGDGTFQPGQSVAVGPGPTAVVVTDLNGDGRPDLVTTDSTGDEVSVLLGNGDGTFQAPQTFAVGRSPRALVEADLLGDGIPDLIVANYNDNTVSVLLGRGDGTFLPQEVFRVGAKPYSLTVADLTGDGRPDVIVANSASDTVSVLLNLGGSQSHVAFAPQVAYPTGRQPFAITAARLGGNGPYDVVTANVSDNSVSVLLGNGNGTFQPPQSFEVGARPYSVAVADVNGDDKPDIVTTNYGGNNLSVLLGNGDGSFQPAQSFGTGALPVQTVVADVNGDGRPDLISVSNADSATGVLLGNGDGTFQPATAANGVGLRSTPFLVDLNGDGIPDSVVLDNSGEILYRQGLPGNSDAFAPPVVLNPGRPARAIAIVKLGSEYAVAAADARYDPSLSQNGFVFSVAIYTVSSDGGVSRLVAFSSTALPTSITAADLTGNGLDDLITANALDDSVSIALQTAPGHFSAPVTIPTGVAPADIAVADFNGDGLPDIIVTDASSGDITVLLNNPAHTFSQTLRFRAGTDLYGVSAGAGNLGVSSNAQTVSLVVGNFTRGGQDDLAVINQGTHTINILTADGIGGFASPTLALTTSTSDGLNINARAGAIVAGDFNANGTTDLAVLMQDTGQVWVYTGDGLGHFHHTFSIAVGAEATGLSVVPGAGPGLFNLLVGNGFGDVLTLVGKGDGTFQIEGSRVSLSVVPNLLGPGKAGVLVGNEQDNRVTVQAPSASGNQYATVQTLTGSGSSTQLAPGDVQWAVLDQGATLPDAIVVSTGNNAVIVYRTIGIVNGAPVFAPNPRTYFVGTAPTSVTVADINGDGTPDLLVADQGSNDVSVLFGSYDAQGDWVGVPGPRLKSGGDGPIEVVVANLTGNGIPELAIVNGESGTVALLPGVGRGFFNDQRPQTLFRFNSAVVQPPTFTGSGVGYAVTAGGALERFDLNDPAAGASVVFTAAPVVAAQALASGDVVAALADGSVDVLAPMGNGLRVASMLQAQGSTPLTPSAIQVVTRESGQFDVLVSSEGSDTLSVFAQETAAVPTAPPPPPSAGAAGPSSPGQAPMGATTPLTAVTTTATIAMASATSVSATTSASATTTALSAIATPVPGLSLGRFASQGSEVPEEAGGAILVPVDRNTYFSVPVLDFGAEGEAEADQGASRMPWLWTLFDSGDSSPLTRFVVGLDDAVQVRRGESDEPPAPTGPDPWNEDLFQPRLRPPPRGPAGSDNGNPGPSALRPDTRMSTLQAQMHFGEDHPAEPRVPQNVVAGACAGLLLTRGMPVRSRVGLHVNAHRPAREPHR